MKNWLIVFSIVVMVVLGSAQAKILEFDDSSFDYSDSSLETAYVLLENQQGILKFTFSSLENAKAVATIDVSDEVTGYDTDNAHIEFWMESYYRVQHEAADVFKSIDLDYRGNQFERVTLLHEDQIYKDVKNNYLHQLDDLGFDSEAVMSGPNMDVYNLQSGNETLRVVFFHLGNDTQVSFSHV